MNYVILLHLVQTKYIFVYPAMVCVCIVYDTSCILWWG